MKYDYFNKIEFLEDKIAAFERNHYERLLELEGFSTEVPRIKEDLQGIVDDFARGIAVLKEELRKLMAEEEAEE